MTVSRTIFAFAKSPKLWLFMLGVVIALGAVVFYALSGIPKMSQCTYPFSFYDLRNDETTLTRGVYHSYRDGINRGHVSFVGRISRFKGDQLNGTRIPVEREVRFTGFFTGNTLEMKVLGQSRQLGDQSSDQDVRNYVFPQITPGDTAVVTFYQLDGKVLATGSDTVARVACVN